MTTLPHPKRLATTLTLIGIVATSALTLAACAPHPADSASPATQPTNTPSAADAADGPHAPTDRPTAERTVTTNDARTTQRIAIDFGNTTNGNFAAPKRGTLVHPTSGTDASPLIILSHLRAPNCQDLSFAYPCPNGVEEFRYDNGMIYLADHLAEQGYTVIIPDLGPIYIGADHETPYSQTALWEDTVTTFIDSLRSDTAGTTNIYGTTFPAPIDFTTIGLFAHSRSGEFINSAHAVAGQGNLKSVFAYGPAYDTVELAHISPALPDIPYLALVGASDSDVGPSANLLLGHWATTPRTTPAVVAEVPGLGHMYINRAASAATFDDRIGCDVLDCPDAAAHETVLTSVAADWFNATLRGADTTLPTIASSPLPQTVAGLPAHWLALTPNAVSPTEPADFLAADGGTVNVCTYSDGMSPTTPGTPCPETEAGVVQVLTPVVQISGSATAKVEVAQPKGIVLHVAPSGTYEATAGGRVTVTLALAGGDVFTIDVPATHPALASKKTEIEDGTYRLGTIRLPLDELLAQRPHVVVLSVMITAHDHPVNVRAVEFWK